jgi:hypothetical protein
MPPASSRPATATTGRRSDMPAMTEGLNLGDLLKYEAPNLYSRDRVTVAPARPCRWARSSGMVTATGKVKQIDPSATDGSQYAAGVLMQAVRRHPHRPRRRADGGASRHRRRPRAAVARPASPPPKAGRRSAAQGARRPRSPKESDHATTPSTIPRSRWRR